jgi:hypothetical protein
MYFYVRYIILTQMYVCQTRLSKQLQQIRHGICPNMEETGVKRYLRTSMDHNPP